MAWDREKERRAGKALGIGGGIYGVVFMIIWCGIAAFSGAGFMLIPGVLMLGFMIFRLVVMIKKAKGESAPKEPWEQPEPRRSTAYTPPRSGHCPYCGERLEDHFIFCPKCGRRR